MPATATSAIPNRTSPRLGRSMYKLTCIKPPAPSSSPFLTASLDLVPTFSRVREPSCLILRAMRVDYKVMEHLFPRAEYRGFVYGRPDFNLDALHSGATTHTAQPSAGIVFRF